MPALLRDLQAEELLPRTSGYLHLGFLTARGPAELADLARAAGFTLDHDCYASEVVARELAVPTSIFKAFARCPEGRLLGIEAFTPQADAGQIQQWRSLGIGAHLGLGLRLRNDLERALQLGREAGLRPPAFLSQPLALNAAQHIHVLYLEGGPFRLEFYHSAWEERNPARCWADF